MEDQTQLEPVTNSRDWLKEYITVTPNFPRPGIQFQSWAPLLACPQAFKRLIEEMAHRYQSKKIDAVLGLDARGFILGSALAYHMGCPFVAVRKQGKLPGPVISIEYSKEYGSDAMEIESASIKSGTQVLIVDDLIATGGTAKAACMLVRQLGAEIVEVACLIELTKFSGRRRLGFPLFSFLEV